MLTPDNFEYPVEYMTRLVDEGFRGDFKSRDYIAPTKEMIDHFMFAPRDEDNQSVFWTFPQDDPDHNELAEQKWNEIRSPVMEYVKENYEEDLDDLHELSLGEFEKNMVNMIAAGIEDLDVNLNAETEPNPRTPDPETTEAVQINLETLLENLPEKPEI